MVCILDCLLPFIFAIFYPDYSHYTQVISALGSLESPVRSIFNFWMVVLGCSMNQIGLHNFKITGNNYKMSRYVMLIITCLCRLL